MSLIGTAIGALVALLPRPEKPAQIPVESEIERLTQENKGLTRSQARLVDHIQTLERELLTEQHICSHWKAEAMRLATQAREQREQLLARLQQLPQGNQFAQYQAQGVNPQYALAQNQQAQAQQLGRYVQAQEGVYGFCNCVPSRSQVWGADRGDG